MQEATIPQERGESLGAIGVILLAFVIIGGWMLANAPTQGPMLLAYGDSIVVGKGASDPWPQRLSAQVDAMSGRTLIDDPGAAQRIAKHLPVQLWLAIGTNDYGKSKATPAQFREAYERLVDGVHAESPRTYIYAQTPLIRQVESPNKLGASLWEYRQAIMDVCATRAWVQCVDGTQILTIADMPDGLHPGTDAQRRYATFVDMQLRP